MKLPFVSRALYDVVVFQRDTARLDEKMRESIATMRQMEWTDALHHERAQYAALLARYHALKLQGAATPEPERVIPAKPIDLVLSAINDASAGKDAKVRVGMIRQAAVDKEAGLKETDIILRIQRGNRPAEEVS